MTLVAIDRSPLRVRRKDDVLTATYEDGGVAIEGHYGPVRSPEPFVAHTASGTWRVQRGEDKTNTVLDGAGRAVARLVRRTLRATLIELPGRDDIPVSRGRSVPFVTGSRIGDLATCRAPFLFPRRHFTVKLADEALTRPDRELVLALGVYLAEAAISATIDASVYAG